MLIIEVLVELWGGMEKEIDFGIVNLWMAPVSLSQKKSLNSKLEHLAHT